MQRSFLLLSGSSSSFFRTASPSSAMRLNPLMAAKFHCQAFESSSGSCLPCSSPFGGFCRVRLSSQLELRKARVSSMISINHSRVPQGFVDGFKLVSAVNSNIRPVSLNSLSYSSLNNGIALSSLDYFGICKRHFSQPSTANKGNKNMNGFRKYWKNKKPLAARSEGNATNSSITKSKDVDALSLDNQIAEGMNTESSVSTSAVSNSKQKSKVKGKLKKQLKSKAKKELPSSTAVSEGDALVKPLKSTSQKDRSIGGKSGQSLTQVTEMKSIGNAPEEALNDSASTKRQSKKKSVKSSVPLKAANKLEGMQTLQNTGTLKQRLKKQTFKQLYPPTGKSVLVVESVTKAKVIQGYLGDMFEVLPSYGHVRDLAPRSGSVRPDEDFSMLWEVPSASWTHLKSIKVALSGAENLILASDPDREGEAIAWHILEMLQQQDALHEGVTVARVVFNEITEASIKSALQAPREIDENLVRAYLARRALDYLIGFNISPLLWRKLPGCQSAGRVQSAALSLICDREMEIDEFKPQEYWTIDVELKGKEFSSLVNAHLTQFDSKKLNQLSISCLTEAKDIEEKIKSATLLVLGSKTNKQKRKPPTPYITSTLQQDAASKLHFNATHTMKLAQKLYEGVQFSDGKAKGLITYTRTDGLHISDEAVKEIRSFIHERYGSAYAVGTARKYFKKVKNAQEAHEAIRPTDVRILPSMLVEVLDDDSLKLYTLIWARTIACQMEPAVIELIQVEIANAGESIVFRTGSSKVEFPGYQAVYEDADTRTIRYKENDGQDRQEAFEVLKSLKRGDPLHLDAVELKQHSTQPPSRYSEGSLVKKLEELGIGRPSTYASTLKVLQDRNYVTVKSRVLYPEFRGRMVSAFLSHHFTEVTDYSFTADMETELDNVSAGLTEWKGLLKDYWTRFSSYCSQAQTVNIRQVEKMLEKEFEDYLFGSLGDRGRTCPSCGEGTLTFKVSRFGAGYFIGCDQHPKCKYIAKTLYGDEDDEEENPQNNPKIDEPKVLGLHPGSSEKILLKNGPFGFYLQLGEDRHGYTPKRASASHIKDVKSITVEDALDLFQYPKTLGKHPKDGHPVLIKLAKTGFSVKHRRTNATVPKNIKPEDLTMEKAMKLLSSDSARHIGRPKNKPKLEAFEAM